MNFPSEPLEVLRELEEAGYEAWIVGGAVRDGLLGHAGHDVDITTNATPEEIEKVFHNRKTIDVGKAFGTVRVVFPEGVYEVTTYRSETSYRDGRHPEIVAFSNSIEEDLKRRDFTMNAMAWHPEKGLLDLFSGREDLQKGQLRAVGRASERIAEDGLRMLRAVRFAARFSLVLEDSLAEAIRREAPRISRISEERCLEEIERMLLGKHPARTVDLLSELGLWEVLFPELEAAKVSRDLLERVPEEPAFRWAALGRDASMSAAQDILQAEEVERQKRHRREANRMRGILRRFKSSNKLQDEVVSLLQEPQTSIPATLSEAQRFVGRTKPQAERILSFLEASVSSQSEASSSRAEAILQEARSFLGRIKRQSLPVEVADLAIHGGDLLRMGLPSGPLIGTALLHLLNLVIDGKTPNTQEALEAVCTAWKEERSDEANHCDRHSL